MQDILIQEWLLNSWSGRISIVLFIIGILILLISLNLEKIMRLFKMTDKEYIETLNICGRQVRVGMDDYGQCYFFEFVDDNGDVQSIGCGTYNTNYLEEIYGYFDPIGTMISIYGKESFDESTKNMLTRYEKYKAEDTNDEYNNQWYEEVIKPRLELKEWNHYDFEAMYNERSR